MDVVVTADLSRITDEQMCAIYDAVGFSLTGTARSVDRLFGPGVFGFLALDRETGEPVGLLRALSDDVLVAWIAEICVLPSHQRMGIGRRLMQAANERFSGLALYAEPFTHNVDFITKQGLQERPILVACARAPLRDLPLAS